MAHKFKCSGMQNILNGFLKYRSSLRPQLQKQFEALSNNPNVTIILQHSLKKFLFLLVF
jgi:hypothetical protein